MSLVAEPFVALAEKSPAEAIRRLGLEWAGRESAPLESHGITDGVPHVLRWLHAQGLATAHQNAWISPAQLAPDETRADRLTFYVENQGVCDWALDPREANGPVWVRVLDEGTWRQECPSLELFLLRAVLFESIVGAEWGGLASDCAAEAVSELREQLRRVPGSGDGLGELLVGEDLLVTVLPNEGGFSVWAGAKTVDGEDRLLALGVEFD